MDVRDVMSAKPITIFAEAELDDAMRLMDDNDVRHLPVMRDGELVGVVSDRDLIAATGWLPKASRPQSSVAVIGELVKRPAITATPDDSVVMMAVDMVSREIGCLPVMDGGRLIGIVTEMDLLEAYLDICEQDSDSLELHAPVAELMSTKPLSLTVDATLDQALELMRARHIRHLPVVDEERVVGIVSDRDLRRATARQHSGSTPLGDLMSHDPLTLDPEEPLSRAASCLHEARISALPVEDDGRLVGILTLTDILDYCIANLRAPDRK